MFPLFVFCHLFVFPYQRLLAKGKRKKVALTAAMRKLITILNTMVRTNQLWRESAIG